MGSPKLHILDVGHGNCCVLEDLNGVVVFDAGPGGTLLSFLHENRITTIDEILVSHADSDHIYGLITVLLDSDTRVKRVRLNPDASKRTEAWQDLRIALAAARKRLGEETEVVVQLTTNDSRKIIQGAVEIEIVAPKPELALGGAGSVDLKGRALSSNSVSAVVRLLLGGTPLVLLPGDLDTVGLDNLIDDHHAINSKTLLFPHHGGLSRSKDPVGFATQLCQLVLPDLVVFSIGRGKHATPNPLVVDAARRASNNVYIACTQLSERCADALPASKPNHLGGSAAKGRINNSCCAGTITIEFDKAGTIIPNLTDHRKFVQSNAPTPVCKRPV